MKIAVTGAKGLLGWHTSGRIHAENCSAAFKGQNRPYDLVQIDRQTFADDSQLSRSLKDVDAVIHFAGVNRGNERDVEQANPDIARRLVEACKTAGIKPHILYANSTHAGTDTFYGRSKKQAGQILASYAEHYTDLVLPHIFGECARPYYNNVTATLIDKLWKNEEAEINPAGQVELLHAGQAANMAIDSVVNQQTGTQIPSGRNMKISELYEKLRSFHNLYADNIFPVLDDPFDLALFNSYRTAALPNHYPKKMLVNRDHRGMLFESAKGGSNGTQSFLSTTLPKKTRGDHFHLELVERFLVVHGTAIIRIRKVLTSEIHEFRVSGDEPVAIDMIPLHTHHIENISDEPVITYFWANHMFDPSAPDTFADPV